MKILITGGSGFIGNILLRKLLLLNTYILAVSKNADYFNRLESSQIVLIENNLILEDDQLKKINEFKPEILIHLAWEGIPDYSKNQ